MTVAAFDEWRVEASNTSRFIRLLLIAVLVVPVVLFSSAAWLYYRAAFEEAHEAVIRTAEIIQQHALKVLQTDELMVDQIAERVDDIDWPEIARSAQLHSFLRQLAAMPDLGTTGLIAPDQTVVATSREFPMPAVKANRRSYLEVPRNGRDPIYITDVIPNSYSGEPQFWVARHKPNSEKTEGGGLIFVSVPLATLVQYYRSVADPERYVVTMVRSDGAVLARHPNGGFVGRVLSADSSFRQSIERNPEWGAYNSASDLDRQERLFAYRKVGPYPVYVVVGLNRAAVINHWLSLMATCLLFGLPVVAALILLTLFANRQSASADGAMAVAREEAKNRMAAENSLRHAQKMEALGHAPGDAQR
jgi:two-component system NtrC family sensor kinase